MCGIGAGRGGETNQGVTLGKPMVLWASNSRGVLPQTSTPPRRVSDNSSVYLSLRQSEEVTARGRPSCDVIEEAGFLPSKVKIPTEHARARLPSLSSSRCPTHYSYLTADKQLPSAHEKANACWLVALAIGLNTRHFFTGVR